MVKTTYLEMFARPERAVPPPREGLAVVHAKKPSVAYYRFLYDAVGRDYDYANQRGCLWHLASWHFGIGYAKMAVLQPSCHPGRLHPWKGYSRSVYFRLYTTFLLLRRLRRLRQPLGQQETMAFQRLS